MITMETGRLLGSVRTEYCARSGSDGAQSAPHTEFRPEQTPLLNDGCWQYWMAAGEEYELHHDGTGWRVTCENWPADTHTYRLASPDGDFVDRLPIDVGEVALVQGQLYALRYDAQLFAWTVNEK
jgi:hypothetical protein